MSAVVRRFVLLLALTALVSACTSVGASTTSRVPDERAPIVAVAGCEGAWTDPADDSADRTVARCAPGSPAPRPLSQHATLVVVVSYRMEYAAPVLLADSFGEFAKENLEVRFVSLPSYDALPQLSQGQVDAVVGGYEVALFNAEHIGLGIKAVIGNYFPPSAGDYSVAQTGLWCRRSAFSDPTNPDIAEVQDMTWGSTNGKASVSFYYSAMELSSRVPGFDPEKVRVVSIPVTESSLALSNGAVDCVNLIDPAWIEFANGDYVLAATQTPGEPLGMVTFGRNLLRDSPAVGDAFTRAVLRTINTYLSGDYHADPGVMAALSKAINQPVAMIARTPSLQFDWELRAATPDRIQRLYIDLGVITGYEHPVPEPRIIDRSFTDRAVGRTD